MIMNNIAFPKLGISLNISPVAFSIGSKPIYWYALIILSGFLLGLFFVYKTCEKRGVKKDNVWDIALFGLIFGIISARIYYVLFALDEFDSIADMFKVWNGGLAIYGGIIGALLGGLTVAKIQKMEIMPVLDIAMVGFLIGQGIGRWGNFMNQEAFGSPTDLPWRMMSEGTDNIGVHPCFFYESMWCLLGFVLLHFYGKYKQKYSGQIFFMYLVWYGFERTVVEGLRTDSLYLPFQIFGADIRVSQVLSAVIFITGIVFLIINRKKEDSFYADYRRKKGIGTGKGRGKEADA
jgi:phosphatidylglycerol:prolipoprotein diacylglycerol transferase